ncbi:hypothetical protein ACHAWC_002236 [Mediolabrus comicus]
MIDIGVDGSIKQKCLQARELYTDATKRRQKIKKELESRILPSSMEGSSYSTDLEEEQIEMLEHWVDELDMFEGRVKRFKETVFNQYGELMVDNSDPGSNMVSILQNLRMCVWGDHTDDDHSILAHLLQFREEIKAVESQLLAASAAYEGLASLTASESAVVSLERVRKLLYSIPTNDSLECTIQVQLSQRAGGFDDPYCGSETLGVDVADLLLYHSKVNGGNDDSKRGGNIEQVGSSGEKSRILLAIETCLPGAIGATCNASSDDIQIRKNPIAIVYDEIDAHVGGRAAVTIAKLLADQSSGKEGSPQAGNQIIAITHSASVAAIADRHIVIERSFNNGSSSSAVRATVVDGANRRKEIARMASGDLAVDEAETFADALIRDALLHRES